MLRKLRLPVPGTSLFDGCSPLTQQRSAPSSSPSAALTASPRYLRICALFGAVMALTAPSGVLVSPAYAHGGGGGGGGGGNGGGNGGGDHSDGHSDGHADGTGHGAGEQAGAEGHGSAGHGSAGHGSTGHGSTGHADRDHDKNSAHASNRANALGRLNAAHASSTARAHAAPNSAVGNIAAYTQALNRAQAIPDLATRQAAIAKATADLNSNKAITPGVVDRLNAMLGLSP
jgi:hypothetical protein